MGTHAFNKKYRHFLKLKRDLTKLGISLRGTLGMDPVAKSIKHEIRAEMRTKQKELVDATEPGFKKRYKQFKKKVRKNIAA